MLAAVIVSQLLLVANSQFASAQSDPILLQAASSEKTFRVEITWTPNEIGKENRFDIMFIEPETEIVVEDIKYDIMLLQEDKVVRGTLRVDQMTTQQKYIFKDVGSYVLKIDDIEDLGESVSVPLEVTPEFPLGAPVIAGISFLAIIALVAASKARNGIKL